MFCPKCGNQNYEDVSFCRRCGIELENSSLTSGKRSPLPAKHLNRSVAKARSKDPDELTSDGIGSVIVGDGFFMVAIFLSVTNSSISSLLWLFLLIPAFYYFGRGAACVLHARQIRQKQKRDELNQAPTAGTLPPPHSSVVDLFKKSISGELTNGPSVMKSTTGDLQ